MFLEDLSYNWDSRVDGVRNNKDESFGSSSGNPSCKVPDNSRVDLISQELVSFLQGATLL